MKIEIKTNRPIRQKKKIPIKRQKVPTVDIYKTLPHPILPVEQICSTPRAEGLRILFCALEDERIYEKAKVHRNADKASPLYSHKMFYVHSDSGTISIPEVELTSVFID